MQGVQARTQAKAQVSAPAKASHMGKTQACLPFFAHQERHALKRYNSHMILRLLAHSQSTLWVLWLWAKKSPNSENAEILLSFLKK